MRDDQADAKDLHRLCRMMLDLFDALPKEHQAMMRQYGHDLFEEMIAWRNTQQLAVPTVLQWQRLEQLRQQAERELYGLAQQPRRPGR